MSEPELEYKADWNPEPIVHTLTAFANDFDNMGGGYILIGIEEEKGRPKLPAKGLDADKIDDIQLDILNKCNFIEPRYIPVIEPCVIDGKDVLVLWAPGGEERPYIGAELDIVFPKHKIAIEPGAWYYHQDKLEHDQWKRKACAEIGIRLITVYYGVNGEYESNEQDVLLIESVCVTEKDKEAMGQRLMESLGILDSLMAS